MKRRLQFVFLLIINVSFAQEIAIPYRDGKKWGICNAEAKLLIEPKFDNVEFYTFWGDYRVLISKVKDLKGLIIEGKEILPPVYQSIYRIKNLYVVTKNENGQKRADIIFGNGKSILAKPIMQVMVMENFDDKFQFFQVLNLDNTESVFIYDVQKNTISQWIYEDCYSLDLLRIRDVKQVHFKIKRKENDGVSLETWDFSQLPNAISRSKTYNKSEADLMALFINKNYRRDSEDGGGSGSGNYGIKADTGDMLVIDEPVSYDASKQVVKKTEPVYMSNKFQIENDKLVLITQNERVQNSPKKTALVNLKVPLKDIKIEHYTTLSKKNDTINYFQNLVFYQRNNKKGILFSSKTKNLMEFDTIAKRGTWFYDEQKNNKLVYIVGNKEAKTNNFKYSFYSSDQKLLFPLQFDELKPSILMHDDGIKTFVVKTENKYGIVLNNGVEILKSEYDEIKEFQSSNSTLAIVQVKKGNKYRFITQKYSQQLNQKPAFFEYPLKDIMLNYPKKDWESSEGITQTINLLELVDENKKFVGYASDNGILYFKN